MSGMLKCYAFDTLGDLGVTLTVLKGTQLFIGDVYDAFRAIPNNDIKTYFCIGVCIMEQLLKMLRLNL